MASGAAMPVRLNLGCGFDLRPGYLNVDLHDRHHPDLVADVTDLSMLDDGAFVELVAQDVLEHLPRTATSAALSEWNRLLAPGGLLILRLPSLFDLVDLFRRGEQVPARHETMLQCLFGTQAYTGDTHLTCFTRLLLEEQLDHEGFAAVSWELRDGWLFEVEAEKTGPSAWARRWAPWADLLRDAGPEGFVAEAYEQVLGRAPDPEGETYWRDALTAGSLSYHDVIRALEASPEAEQRGTVPAGLAP